MAVERYVSPEERRNIFIEENINKMNSEMQTLLMNESMGGNAGSHKLENKDHVCSAANGFMDQNTGEIKIFGNIQSVSQKIRNNYAGFSFQVARILDIDIGLTKSPIFESYLPDDISEDAKEVINKSIQRYNIDAAISLRGLKVALEATGDLIGSEGKKYNFKELNSYIEQVERGELLIDSITRTAGLRDKLSQLLPR